MSTYPGNTALWKVVFICNVHILDLIFSTLHPEEVQSHLCVLMLMSLLSLTSVLVSITDQCGQRLCPCVHCHGKTKASVAFYNCHVIKVPCSVGVCGYRDLCLSNIVSCQVCSETCHATLTHTETHWDTETHPSLNATTVSLEMSLIVESCGVDSN